jgi:hypothetical protein
MLIAGAYEVAASYIDAKSKQSKIDVAMYTYQMLADIAHGRLYTIPLWAGAIAGAAALAGTATIASAYLRSEGQRKSEELAPEQMAGAGEPGSAAAESNIGQRKQATGIVNTRPISINVYSTSYFQAGNMIFGDSEGAFQDLYDEQIRPKIEGDFDSGMIHVA